MGKETCEKIIWVLLHSTIRYEVSLQIQIRGNVASNISEII